MHSPVREDTPKLSSPATPLPKPASSVESSDAEPHNLVVLTAYQVILRVGWIFKTESIIMPAVLDLLGGGAWLRGCLPLLNRFGQSVPPLLMSRRVKVTRRKKRAMSACAFCMALCFLTLAFLWFSLHGANAGWLPIVFLAVYAVFFMSTGVHQLCFSTLQGKLVEATHRGRLMLFSNVIGATSACLCAWWLLPGWLRSGGAHFHFVFGFTGVCFLLAAVTALALRESPDDFRQSPAGIGSLLSGAWGALRDDRNFRRLAMVAALFGVSLMLFPHYQALARQRLGMRLDNLMIWVVVQNAGTALCSIFIGPLADRRGNRLVLRILVLGICAAPALAIGLAAAGTAGRWAFPIVFLLVGMTPVVIRTLHNYTLEISSAADHPRYLSTLSLCASVPAACSPLVGAAIGWWGFEVVFAALMTLIFTGWLLTFGLLEPRSRAGSPPAHGPQGR